MINQLIVAPPSLPEPPASPGRELCAAVGLTDDLAERLVLDGAGRPFIATALDLADPAAFPAQIELLMRPDPVGGFEPLLQANRERLIADVLARLHERLAAGAETGAARALLLDVQQELRRLRAQLDEQVAELNRSYEGAHAALRAWQEASGRKAGLLHNLAAWLIGGPEHISAPQAAALFNERERLALIRAAVAAASAVIGRIADEVAALLDRQEALLRALQAAAATVRARLAAPPPEPAGYAPWSWRANPAVVADRLADGATADRLAAELLGRLIADGDLSRLAEHSAELAASAAEELITGLSLARCIELEAGADGAGDFDPLVLVGQRLLSELEERPSWRLRRGCRPRIEVVQVTADGEPVYQLEGLGTAAYGAGGERIGFVRVELGVAIDDLQLMHEGDEAFRRALIQRNLFLIEELAAQEPSGLVASTAQAQNGLTTPTTTARAVYGDGV